jgi:hypothetical protein
MESATSAALEELRGLPSPVVDRAIVEKVLRMLSEIGL